MDALFCSPCADREREREGGLNTVSRHDNTEMELNILQLQLVCWFLAQLTTCLDQKIAVSVEGLR